MFSFVFNLKTKEGFKHRITFEEALFTEDQFATPCGLKISRQGAEKHTVSTSFNNGRLQSNDIMIRQFTKSARSCDMHSHLSLDNVYRSTMIGLK